MSPGRKPLDDVIAPIGATLQVRRGRVVAPRQLRLCLVMRGSRYLSRRLSSSSALPDPEPVQFAEVLRLDGTGHGLLDGLLGVGRVCRGYTA